MSALVNYERLWSELEMFDRQIRSGSRIHLPTYHRTLKALDAVVAAVCQGREVSTTAKPSREARQCDGKRTYGSYQAATNSLNDHGRGTQSSHGGNETLAGIAVLTGFGVMTTYEIRLKSTKRRKGARSGS